MNAFAVAVLCLVGRSANGLQPSMDYAVKVNGEDTFVYLATVPGPTGSNPMRTNVSFIQVVLPSPSTSSGARVANVEVFVTGNSSVGTAALRPRGSPAVTVQGLSTVKFGLKEPGTHILELNGEWEVNSLSTGLMIFVTEADPSPPSPADSSVIYFGAGVHTVAGDNGTLTLANDSTVYLAHGAVVLGHIVGNNVQNVTIKGNGILAAEWLPGNPPPEGVCGHCGCPGGNGVSISNSKDIALEGITIMHVASWMVKFESNTGVRVNGIKEFGWRCNNDGIDIVSSQDVIVENVFIRSADDAIAVKGMDTTMETKNVIVRDSFFFPHGNCMEIGFELWNDAVTNITFERNLCVHQMMNVFSIHNGGHAAVSGVTYKDIVVEGVLGPVSHDESYGCKVLDLQVSAGKYSGPDMLNRGSISNIVYSNVTYRSNGLTWINSRMVGNSTRHGIRNVVVDAFVINGSLVKSMQDLNTITNPFVQNITFS
eukprot:gene3313-32908_t